jgi:RNA polymerase sigma-70 factor (ECF subfamily)
MGDETLDYGDAALRAAGKDAPLSPRELVSRAYEEYRDGIYRHLIFLGGTDRSTAQDLTQECFLKLYVSLTKGQQIQNVRAWLITVATNQWLNLRRAARYRQMVSPAEASEWMETLPDPGADPETQMLEQGEVQALQKVIASLTSQQQVCLHLRAEGMRYREIAKILGVSVPTVSIWIRRVIEEAKKVIHVY